MKDKARSTSRPANANARVHRTEVVVFADASNKHVTSWRNRSEFEVSFVVDSNLRNKAVRFLGEQRDA